MVNIKVCKESFSDSGEIVAIDNDGTVIVQSLRTGIGMMQSGSGTPSGANIRPIVRWDSVVTHRSDTEYGDGNEYLSDLGTEGITAFEIDVITGEVTVTGGLIESYNGETLPGAWLSDRDAYVSGSTPSIGAQVAYELAQPYSFTATPQFIALVDGMNYLWTVAHGKTAKDDSYGGESITLTATDMTVLTAFTVDFAPKQDGIPGITTETGSIVSFDNTDEVAEIKDIATDIALIQEGSGTPTPLNVRPFDSRSQLTIHHNDNEILIALGRNVYGGTLDVTTGELTVNKVLVTFDGTEDWVNNTGNSINLDIDDIYQPTNMMGDRYIKSDTAYADCWALLNSTDVVGGGLVGTMITRG